MHMYMYVYMSVYMYRLFMVCYKFLEYMLYAIYAIYGVYMYRPNRDHIWLLEFHAEEIPRERLARVKSQHITRKAFANACPHT